MKKPMTIGQFIALLQNMPKDTPIKAVHQDYLDRENTVCLKSIELSYDDNDISMVLHLKDADTETSSSEAA